MSLVSYGLSDGSEDEDSIKVSSNSVQESDIKAHSECKTDSALPTAREQDLVTNTSSALHQATKELAEHSNGNNFDASSGLFVSLPRPLNNSSIILADSETNEIKYCRLTSKKTTGTVKITVPPLSELKSEDECRRFPKSLKTSTECSRLFSLLPAPKFLSVQEPRQLMLPNKLAKRSYALSLEVNVEPDKKRKKPSMAHQHRFMGCLETNGKSRDENNDETSVDFLSLCTESPVDTVCNQLISLDHNTSSIVSDENGSSSVKISLMASSNSSLASHPLAQSLTSAQIERTTSTSGSEFTTVSSDSLQISEEAIKRLCGPRSKHQAQKVAFIDINEDTLMPDSNEWLTKQLSVEKHNVTHNHRKTDGPTLQQKRKHQITYLAFKAKENEIELKNQWSQNRMSRKQTQSKYGF